MKHLCPIVFFLFFAVVSSAQNITYNKSTFDRTGEGGTMVTPDASFTNTGSDTIEVIVNRFYKNLPANWSSCFCFVTCHLPSQDTLHFFLPPGEKAIIGVGFNTDTIPGVGYVKITVEQVGGTQKDTLSFSGSTMIAGIQDLTNAISFRSFPNPFTEKIVIRSGTNGSFSVTLYDLQGKMVRSLPQLDREENEIYLNELSKGEYILQLTYESGKTGIQKIIKH